jgi:branched-chain amino acid transport system permease protein
MAARKTVPYLAVAALLAAGGALLDAYWLGLLTQAMIFAILAMSLDILLGYTGLPSLGHAGLFGVAAYAVAVATTAYHANVWVGAAAGVVVGIVISAALGLLVSHVRDVYFLMITLALGMVLWGLAYRWIPVTGGDNGISDIPRLGGPVRAYYVTFLVFVGCSAAMAVLVASPFGFTLRGIRENEERLRSLGLNTWLHCYVSYIAAGAFASIAGVVWASYNGFVGPTYVDLTSSSEVFLMVTLGGPGTLVGPAVGASAIVLLKNVMSAYTERWLLILGVVYIVTMLAAPQGLWNLWRSGRRHA